MVLSILMLWWTGAALAGRVDVEDDTGCIEEVALREALVPMLGTALQRIDVGVSVGVEGEAREIQVAVDVGAQRWAETISIVPSECAFAPAAIALVIQRGLATLPGLDWERLQRPPPRVRVGGSLGLSGPLAPRVLMDGRATVGRTLRGSAILRVEGSPLWRTNASRVAGLTVGVAAGPAWRRGFLDIGIELGGQLGVLWVLSRDPSLPEAQALPHGTGTAGVALGGAGPMAVGLGVELARPLLLVTAEKGDVVGVEPALRGMLSLRFQGKIGPE